MPPFSAILFDLDDTLIDFKKSEEISLKKCYDRYFHHLSAWEPFQNHYTEINRALWNQAEAGKLSISEISTKRFEALSEFYCIPFLPEIPYFYEEKLVDHSDWIEGAEELLTMLQTKAIPVGFVTNGFTHLQKNKVKKLGVSRFSTVIVISEECGVAKPHPKIFQRALELIPSQPGTTLMVGDSLTSDGQGAKNISMPFCWYNPNGLPNSLDWKPTLTIRTLKEMTAWLS